MSPSRTVANASEQAQDLKKAALRVADELANAYPRDAEALAVLAIANDRFGSSEASLRLWEKCLELNPAFADAYQGMGTILLKRGAYQEAAEAFRNALKRNPRMADAYAQLAEALMGLGKFREAADVLDQGAKVFPESDTIYFWRGQACLQLRQYEQAIQNHRRAIELNPNSTYAYYGLATAFARLGQRERFEQFMKEFKRRKARDQEAEQRRLKSFDDLNSVRQSAAFVYMAVGEVYRRHGQPKQAEKHLLEACRLAPRDTLCREKLVLLYGQRGRWPEAVGVMKQLVALRPDHAGYILRLGLFRAQAGQFEAAEQAFRQTIQLAPELPDAYAALAQLYLQTGTRVAESLQLASKAVELQATARHYYLLSAAYHRNGQVAQALSAIDRAVELEPDNAEYQQIRKVLRAER